MEERPIGAVVCLLCALPFYALSLHPNNNEPINFWSGNHSLKSKVQNIAAYNREMATLYRKYAAGFLLSGLLCLVYPPAGFILLTLHCTAGIYPLYQEYKKILHKYS